MSRILCTLLGHKFGKWEYVAAHSCEMVRICRRDGYKENRISHRFGEWKYTSPDSCEMMEICERCGEWNDKKYERSYSWSGPMLPVLSDTGQTYYKRARVHHDFREWEYVAPHSCEMVQICKRDGHRESRVLHEFSEWKYVDSVHRNRMCERCGKKQSEMRTTCTNCHGSGKTYTSQQVAVGSRPATCPECGGAGFFQSHAANQNCRTCKGSGTYGTETVYETRYTSETCSVCNGSGFYWR